MDNLLNLINILNNSSSHNNTKSSEPVIPKEIMDQYPYGKFPSQYTRSGQESLRKNSENRFSYSHEPENEKENEINTSFDISSVLPLLQLMNNKNSSKDTMKILSQLLFKDNKDMQKLFELMTPQNKSQEIVKNQDFPNTNKVKISSLKRIDQ